MSSSDGHDGGHNDNSGSGLNGFRPHGTVETMLFESLVFQLIEKGILTKNDALSIVQTVAQVKQGRLAGSDGAPETDHELALLRRLYASFEAVSDRSALGNGDPANVKQLRPPLHQDAPEFPD